MSETPIVDWPYPLSSNLIAEGAVNIEQLAEGIEGQFFIAKNTYTADATWSTYPVGMSMMAIQSDATWPYTNGLVVTYRPEGSNATQYFYSISSVSSRQNVYYRLGYGSGVDATWTKWQTVVGPGTPNAMAAGRVTVTPTAGEPKAVSITLPSNRFKSESEGGLLLVQLSAGGATHPEDISLCTYSISPTTLVIYIWRKSATDTAISWQVTQGLVAAN